MKLHFAQINKMEKLPDSALKMHFRQKPSEKQNEIDTDDGL